MPGLHVTVIGLSTALIVAVCSASLHVQRRKPKIIFRSDSQHQHGAYPALDGEEGTGSSLEDGPASYCAYVRGGDAQCGNMGSVTAPALTTLYEEVDARHGHMDQKPDIATGEASSSGATCSDTGVDTLVPERWSAYRQTVVPPSSAGSDSPAYERDSFHLHVPGYESSVEDRRLTEDSLYRMV